MLERGGDKSNTCQINSGRDGGLNTCKHSKLAKKWLKNQSNFKEDVVRLMDRDVPQSHWSLAKLSETIKSEDGCVRKVHILMSEPNCSIEGKCMGKPVILERPVHKLIHLIRPENNG